MRHAVHTSQRRRETFRCVLSPVQQNSIYLKSAAFPECWIYFLFGNKIYCTVLVDFKTKEKKNQQQTVLLDLVLLVLINNSTFL